MKDSQLNSLKRLQHIELAIENIQKYVSDESLISFCEKEIVHDAVLFQFSVIGEAINHIENSILEKYEYPWYKVRSFRNLIAHEYFNVKMSAVWQIIETELPKFKKLINAIITKEF
ncbi:MAG: DUF86 domain-containing protein [Bacteroidetes bacterium]|nr:DUF86 domain-containing protein [Bacteroidota bacterium]